MLRIPIGCLYVVNMLASPRVSIISSCVCFFLQFPEYDDLYCKYCFVYGQDWAPTAVSWALGRPLCTGSMTDGVSEGVHLSPSAPSSEPMQR